MSNRNENKGGLVLRTPDDLLWVAKPNIRDLFSIIYDPCFWAYTNVTVDQPSSDGKSDPSKVRAYVKKNYSISFQATSEAIAFGTDDIYLQGVHKTNILTLRISSVVAQDFIDRVLLGPVLDEPQTVVRHAALRDSNRDEMWEEDKKTDPPSIDMLIYWAQQIVLAYLPDSPTTSNLVAAIFGNRQTNLTIADRKKAYAHLPLTPSNPALLQRLNKGREGNLLKEGPLVRRGEPDKNLVMSALYHLFAAASPATVEETFNACDPSNTQLLWKTWVQDEQDWSPDSPGVIKRQCFRCMKSGPQPMTITGEGTDYSMHPNEARTGHPREAPKGRPNQWQELAVKPPKDPRVLEEALAGNEEICEVLVSEYEAGDQMVTWCEAFSKTYGG